METARAQMSDFRAMKPIQQLELRYPCDICDVAFSSWAKRSAHKWLKHGVRSEVRLFVPTSKCPVCDLDCGTRIRAIQHVSRSLVCRYEAIQLQPLSDEAVADLDRQDAELARRAKQMGVSKYATMLQ